jgi:hypothetical protein
MGGSVSIQVNAEVIDAKVPASYCIIGRDIEAMRHVRRYEAGMSKRWGTKKASLHTLISHKQTVTCILTTVA